MELTVCPEEDDDEAQYDDEEDCEEEDDSESYSQGWFPRFFPHLSLILV